MAIKKRKKKRNRFYFTKDTEKAIIKYNSLDPVEDNKERDKLFAEEIHFPFKKIAENLIHTYKFYYFDVPPVTVIDEVVSFMSTKMYKFNSDKGKAFSYFSIVAKNYLIYHNNKNYEKYKKHRSLSTFTDAQRNYMDGVLSKNAKKNTPIELRNDYQKIMKLTANYIEEEMDFLFKKERDKNIAYAVIDILRRNQDITNIHKKALYILIREYSKEKTQYITKVLKKITKYYNKINQKYFDEKDVIGNLLKEEIEQ